MIDFSNYKIHIPTEKTAGSLLEIGHEKYYSPEEIYSYEEGIKIILKEGRGLWLPNSLSSNNLIISYFEEMGVVTVV